MGLFDGVVSEAESVLNPDEGASDSTETLLRTNPLTGAAANLHDAYSYWSTGSLDNPMIDEDSAADTLFDAAWEGHEGDSVHVWGPELWGTEGSVADVAAETDEERNADDGGSSPEETKTKLVLGGLAAVVVLWLVRPLLDLAAGVAGDG